MMISSRLIIVLGSLLGLAGAIPSRRSNAATFVVLYSKTDFTGFRLKVQEYIEDLSTHNFDETIQSAVTNGIWLFYEDPKFNELNFGQHSFYGWGEDHKVRSFGDLNKAISSLRYSGAGEGMKYDTINFYEGAGFMGMEQYYFNDSPSLNYDNFGKSLIVTGCSSWTLYEERNFQGDCICVHPASLQNCEPGFYVAPSDFGNFEGKVSSLQKGCFSQRVFKGTHVPANVTRVFSLT